MQEGKLKKSWKYSEVFDRVQIISLKTNDLCLIKDINKLLYIGKRFYILDKGTESLFVFNKQGNFLWKINTLGRGPQEYSRVIDFDINPKNLHLYLYADYPQKLMEYDSSGQFIREIRIGLNGNSIAVQGEYLSVYSAQMLNLIQQQQTTSQLLIRKLTADSLYEYFPSTLKDNDYSCYVDQYGEAFQHTGDELLFWMTFDPHIYSICGNAIQTRYTIDFGEYAPPLNLSIKEMWELKYAYGLNSFWENDKYCFFQSTVNYMLYQFLYDKEKRELCYGNFRDDLCGFFPHIVSATNEYMLAFSSAYELFHHAGYWKKKGITGNRITELVKTMTEYDNPVMFLYEFR